MNGKNDRGISQNRDDDDTQKQERIAEPGRTPGIAEGTVDEVNEALRRQQEEQRRREH